MAELWAQMKLMRKDKTLWYANWGNTWFFFLAALLQLNLFVHANDTLHLSATQNGYLQAALAIGIGGGSFAAGFISRGHIECGLIPLGAMGLAGAAAALTLPGLTPVPFGLCLSVLGCFGGFFIVPVSALLQHRPRPENKGGILAAANLLSFVGIAMASGVEYLLAKVWHLNSTTVFLVVAVFAGLTALGMTRFLWPQLATLVKGFLFAARTPQ